MRTISLDQIKATLAQMDLVPIIKEGFIAYSSGQAVVPPVGELLLDKGEVHIKYGYLRQGKTYVIKIASGFYDNPSLGLSPSNGLMLLFSQQTGELLSVLLDEGHLTDVRTAVAGAIAAKHLAPSHVTRIGIVGTGIQAHVQLQYLQHVTGCRHVLVWGRGEAQLAQYQRDMQAHGYAIETTRNTADVLRTCNLVITCTPTTSPLLHAADLQAGTHITAVGSDTPEKQELDAAILGQADVVVADSISQCLERGDIHKAIESGHITPDELVELGNVLRGTSPGRTSDDQITVADLTGVAVQDIQIATAVVEAVTA